MDKAALTVKAEKLQALIDDEDMLVLPNVWDVGSARVVADADYPVIATSSAGVAWSLGYPDGEVISRDDMLSVIRRIVDRVDLPVSADMEAGYGEEPEAVADTVIATLAAGAVGANIEDSSSQGSGPRLLDYDRSVARIRAGKEASEAAGVPFVINARTDVFRGGGNEDSLNEAIRRCNAYLEVGAGCVFVPFVRERETMERLVSGIDGPVNVLANPAAPSLDELREIGIARVSIGGLFSLMIYTQVREACAELYDTGTLGWGEGNILHPEMNMLTE
ncbi:MAG: Carboxyvinyl-carboxyphosphonate phosphorylmutase [Alphaproteobacteria bacterium MarineAlpha11_Bin1]|nr:MAG: Carboxyvinyl-carboxyphosphonate phosphorylmutase [Alphaproteobacteria bacterium MarineAlpha11_Bin1]